MRFQTILAAALLAAAASPAFAQSTDHPAHHAAQSGGAGADKAAAKITLKHGELKNLEMPAMTMAFHVKNKAWLDKVKAGDKVRFAAENIGGQLTVTVLEPSR